MKKYATMTKKDEKLKMVAEMKIEKTNIITETYKVSSRFYVDVQTDLRFPEYTNFYIYFENYGIKEHVVGLDVNKLKKELRLTTMEEVIEHTVDEYDLYIYYEDYIKGSFVEEEYAREFIKADLDIPMFEKTRKLIEEQNEKTTSEDID